MQNPGQAFSEIVTLVRRLRAPDGCPWDREQTLASITPYILEECHELLDAISRNDEAEICEESGDLLFQIVFLAAMFEEAGRFDVVAVLERIHAKMVSRHPHVFGDAAAHDVETVLKNWERIKAGEAGKEKRTSALDGVPVTLPALARAMAVQRKAARVGFDWKEIDDVLAKIHEEIAELREARADADMTAMRDEFGDVLFALVNLGRKLEIDAEQALTGTIEKFMYRFNHIERRVAENGRRPEDCSLEELDGYWNEAKHR